MSGRQLTSSVWRRRVGAITKFLQDFVEHYEQDQENWEGLTLLEILHGSVRSLATYVSRGSIPWSNPLVELHYPIGIDWEAAERSGLLNYTFARFTPEDTENPRRLSSEVGSAFAVHKAVRVLEKLTNDLVVVQRGGDQSLILPDWAIEVMKELSSGKRRRVVETLCEPFSIGTVWIPDSLARPGPVSRRLASKLKELDKKPRVTFHWTEGRRKFAGSIILSVAPLIVNFDENAAYYPITVGLAFDTGNSPRLDAKQRKTFWKEMLKEIEGQIADLTTWDPSLFRIAETWNRNSTKARTAAKRLRSIDRGTSRLTSVTPREFEELIAELYSGLGCHVRLTKPSKDGGRDIIIDMRGPIPTRVIVECKRPGVNKRVGILPFRALVGVADRDRPNKALLVSATNFTRGVESEQREHQQWRVELVDERKLRRLITKYVEMSEDTPESGSVGRAVAGRQRKQ